MKLSTAVVKQVNKLIGTLKLERPLPVHRRNITNTGTNVAFFKKAFKQNHLVLSINASLCDADRLSELQDVINDI